MSCRYLGQVQRTFTVPLLPQDNESTVENRFRQIPLSLTPQQRKPNPIRWEIPPGATGVDLRRQLYLYSQLDQSGAPVTLVATKPQRELIRQWAAESLELAAILPATYQPVKTTISQDAARMKLIEQCEGFYKRLATSIQDMPRTKMPSDIESPIRSKWKDRIDQTFATEARVPNYVSPKSDIVILARAAFGDESVLRTELKRRLEIQTSTIGEGYMSVDRFRKRFID